MSGLINVVGALATLFGMTGNATDTRIAGAWVLIQFLTGVWAGVLGANSPFVHGLVAGLPALVLGLAVRGVLPPQFVIVTYFVVPSAALFAAMIMRFMRRRQPR